MNTLEKLVELGADINRENNELQEKIAKVKSKSICIILVCFMYIIVKVLIFSFVKDKSVGVQVVSWIFNLLVYGFLFLKFYYYRQKYSQYKLFYKLNDGMRKQVTQLIHDNREEQEKELDAIERLIIDIKIRRMTIGKA